MQNNIHRVTLKFHNVKAPTRKAVLGKSMISIMAESF